MLADMPVFIQFVFSTIAVLLAMLIVFMCGAISQSQVFENNRRDLWPVIVAAIFAVFIVISLFHGAYFPR